MSFGIEERIIKERINYMQKSSKLESFLENNNIRYIAPIDLSKDIIDMKGFDMLYSYSVLQRIEEKKLHEILKQSKEKLKKNAYMLHVIHHSDHNARHDKNLNPLLYLKFGSKYDWIQTKKINYQNRLRNSEFNRIFEQNNIIVIKQKTQLLNEDLLKDLRLNKKFDSMSRKDILISRTQLIAKIKSL